MHYRAIISILLLLLILCSCDSQVSHKRIENTSSSEKISYPSVLDSIVKRKKLRAVTDYGSLSYLIYRGTPMGYQYEMLKAFTDHLGVELEMITESDMYRSVEMLNNYEIDLLAMGLTVTNSRKEHMLFTMPIFKSRQVLVQRKPVDYKNMVTADEIESYLIRDHDELGGKTIYVQKGTVYANKLKSLSNDIGDSINIVEVDMEMEELIEYVAKDSIDYTIADEHIAKVSGRYFPGIDVKTDISVKQKIAWATEKGQTELIDTINVWLKGFKNSLTARLLYNKYFKNIRSRKIANSRYNSYTGGDISPYDDEIKESAKLIGWDWRLLASLVYQESEFKPHVKSWVGAYGLMQLMPEVMQHYSIDSTSSANEHLITGVLHLKAIQNQLPPEITDSIEQIKFVLASYNCGLGHVLDGRRLAKYFNKNPNIWTAGTDSCVLYLSDKDIYTMPEVYYGYTRGEETFNFVNEIMKRYNIYCQLIN